MKCSRCRHLSMFRPWIHEIMECIGQHWAGHLASCKIPEICEVQICIDSVLLSSIWKLISTSLLVRLFGFMYFFQFLPVFSTFFRKKLEEIPFFQFLPFCPEETYFFRKFPNPACLWLFHQASQHGNVHNNTLLSLKLSNSLRCR